MAPRLLDLAAACRYLGEISPRTIRTLIARGIVRRVHVPLGDGDRTLGRVLMDRADLDVLIEAWKDSAGSPS